MIRTPFDNLLASGTETGDAYTEPLVHVPLAGEFPEETTRRVVSNQLRKARDLASYGVPAYADKFGDPQAVTDETGAPLTGFSKKTNTAFDSLGVPRSLIRQPGGAAPVLGDAYEGAEIKTDQKTGAQFKVKPGLPKWRVGTDETVVKRNELAARDKELSKTAAIVGERLSLDQGAYVIGEHQQKAQKRELAGLLKEDFQGQAKIPDGTPFLDVRAQVAKFYDTALADKSASAKEFFSSNYTASAKANRDRLEARKAQALGHVDAMEQRAGMLAQQAELIAPAKEQKRQLAEQRIELHLQEMEARGLDTTPIRAQIARAAEVRAAAEQKAAAPQQPVAPQAAAAPEQGGNFLTDTGVSLGIGINSVLKMAGDLYGLATGNMDNPASKLGKENIEWYEGKKSGALQKVEKERRAAMDALPEDDETGRAWEWVKATFSSPRMITAMLAEQAPNLVPALGAGKLAGTGAAKILLKNASDDAAKAIALKTAGKIGVSAAVGTGAVMQGSDVGGDQYTELVALLHDMPPEQAAAIPEIADLLQRGATLDHAKLAFALTQARTTGALAGGVSIGSQLLPGARILERAAVGLGGKKLAGNIVVRAGKGFLGEGVQEMVEEGVGLGGKNVLAQPVDPTRRWDKGMGETLAMAGATGGILGAVGGAAGRGAADDGTDGTATPPPSGPAAPGAPGTPPTPDSPLNSDAIEQLVGIGIPRDKASQMTMEEAMDAVAAADEKLKAGQGTDIAPAADLAALDDATLDDKTRRMGLIVNQAAVDNSPQAPMLQAALDAMRAEKARREAAKPPAAPVIEQPETQGDAASVVAHTDDNAGSTPAPATLPAAPVDLAGLESSIKGNSDAALTSQPLNENTQTQGVPALPEAAPVQLPAAAKAVEPSSQAEVEPPPVTGQGPAPVAALKGAPATPAPAPAIPEDGMSSAEKGITYTPEDLTNVRFETGTVVRIKLDDGQEIEGEVEYAGTQPFFRGKKGEILALGNGMPDRDTIQSVSVVRSAVESLKAKDARKYGAPELPPPASRDDYERSLYTLSRRIHEENAKENFDGSRRSMQLQAQFDRMADEIELARTKRNYVRGNWRTYFKGGPMPRPIDYMDGPVDAKAQEPPKPSDFDPNREERKKRHDKPIEALPKLAEVRASLADAKQQLAKKSLAPERRAQMERIVAKREKELRDGLYVEAREQKADALPTAAPPTTPAPAKAAPAAKAGEGAKPVEKEPWQMTREDWVRRELDLEKQVNPNVATFDVAVKRLVDAGETPAKAREFILNLRNAGHEAALEKALREGKPVPAEVLADYPDLAKQPQHTAPAPAAKAGEGGADFRSLVQQHENPDVIGGKPGGSPGTAPPYEQAATISEQVHGATELRRADADRRGLPFEPDRSDRPASLSPDEWREAGQRGKQGDDEFTLEAQEQYREAQKKKREIEAQLTAIDPRLKDLRSLPISDQRIIESGARTKALKDVASRRSLIGALTQILPTNQTFQTAARSKNPRIRELAKQWKEASAAERLWSERTVSNHDEFVQRAIDNNEPVSAAAVDAYGIKLPDGYTKRGDTYVLEAKPTPAAPAAPEQAAPKSEGGPMPIVKGMMDASGKSIDELKQRITNVRHAPYVEGQKHERILFDIDGVTHSADLKGRNRDLLIGFGEAQDKAIAARTLLDGDAKPTPAKPEPAAPAAKPSANQADADKLRDLEKVRTKTAAQEKQIELLKARIKADPSKWSIGDGVAYRVNSGGKGVQLNRGFRITEINAAEKLARIVQVADTGLTSSGGDNDRIAAQWIHVAELVREKKYDKPPAKAAPAAEQPAPAPAAAPNNGDEVVFTPKSKRDSTVKGTLVETITNTSGNEGYHILAPLPGDPGRIVRVWKENGEIAVTKPYEQPTPKEAAKPEAKPASGMTVEEARQHLNRPGQIGGYTAESVMEKQQGRGKLAPAATPAAPAAKAGEGGAREAWIAAQMSLSNPPLDAGAPAWIARGDGTTRPSVWFRPPPGDVKATRTTAEKAFAAQYDYYEATRGTGNRDVQASAALQPSQAGGGNQKGGVDVGAGASPDWLDKPYPKPSDREIQQLSDADAARRVDVLNDVIAKESAAITALEKTPAQQRTELQVKAHAATWTRLSSARNALEDMKRAKPTPAAPAAPAAKAGEGGASYETQTDKAINRETALANLTAGEKAKAIQGSPLAAGPAITLRVHHGTRGPAFSAFDESKVGQNEAHKTGDGFYTSTQIGDAQAYIGESGTVISGDVTLNNPAPRSLVKKWTSHIDDVRTDISKEAWKAEVRKRAAEMKADLVSKGYDGYLATGTVGSDGVFRGEVVFFKPEQFKPTPAAPAAPEPAPVAGADAPLPPLLEVERKRGPLVAPYRAALERVEAKLADESLDADAIERLERTRAKIEAKLLALESKAVPGAKKETAEERAAKPAPLNMAGKTRAEMKPEKPAPIPTPEFTAIHPKSQEKFNAAWDARDAAGMKDLLHLTNKGMRAEFERRAGVKLEKTVKGTHAQLDAWATPPASAAALPPPAVPATHAPAAGKPEAEAAKPSLSVSPQSGIQDFGEKLAGQARKDIAASMKREISDDDIVRLPLSEIWPKAEVDAIEDIPLAALATAVRAEIPAKPRQDYKVKQWAEKVKQVRGLMRIAAERGYDSVVDKMDEYRLGQLVNKIRLLQGVPREHWGRIGRVENYPESYSYKQDANGRQAIENGQAVKIPTPFAEAEVDGKRVGATNLSELTDKVSAKLAGEAPTARMKFEVRGREGKGWGINKTGDPLYRKLKTFEDSKEAVAFASAPENYDALVAAWDAVKESDNVKETDVRRETNRDRTGKNWRNGMDATPEMFMESFGFKGAEFGNWVSQGKNVKERQGMLNAAFDALHDLADTVGIPPKAISLNGTLGLGFGSRGHGWASAHFEPGNLVINLTKTRGAGSLAHEWFHALDNYFQRKRNESGLAYGRGDYITNQPETYYESPRGERLSETRYKSITSNRYNAERMTDWKRVEGVRAQVAEAFADLVKVLDASPMSKRAALIDKGKSDGYWSRVIERAARSFENYIIAKMQLAGMSNDYLANVQSVEDFARDKGRYPYLLPDELAPVSAAFDSLFSTFKTEKTDSGVALFSAIAPQSISDVQPKHAIPAHIVSRIVDRLLARWPGAAPTTVIADGAQFPQAIREQAAESGLPLNRLGGAYHDGKVWINAAALGTAARVEQVFMHEQAGHHGVDGLLEGIAPGSRAKLAAQLQEHFPAQWAHVAGNYDAGLQVSETLARIQETFATNEATAKQASAWQRIVDWIRTTLAKAGFRDWTRADVEALLRRGTGRLRGKPGKSGGNAQFSIESEQRDKDYMAAVEAGDMETVQRMVESQRSESIRADVSNLLRLSGKQLMDSDVLASIRESKILDTIIAPVPVDVVNNLGGKQRATEMLLHYLTVPADSFRVGEPNDLVGLVSSAISADSARSAIAGIRAELSDANLRGLNSKMASALDAFQNRLTQLLIRSGTAVGGETFPATESTGAGSSGRGLNVKGGSANLTGLGHGVESTRSSGTSQGLQSISRITPAQDAMYLDAVKSGNTKLAQAMVDEAAKKAGYDVSDAWHGTRSSKPITEFRLSKEGSEEAVFFSDSKDEALQFPYPRGSTSAVRTFLRGDFLEVNAGRELYTPEEMEGWLRRAKKEGKEGVHVRDIQNFENGAISDTYAVFDPSQIKSAEPITRDTNGRVIPLSERFNPATPDIRFSIENESQQQGEQNENTADKTKTRPERDSRDEGIAQENEIFPGYEKLDGKQREAARIVQAVSRESRSPIMWVNMDEGKSGLAVTDDAIINVDPVRLAESAKDVEAVGGDPRAWIRSAFQEEEWHNRQLLLARGGFEETYARLFDLLENAHGTGFVAMLRVIYNAVGKPQFAAEFERMILQHRASQKITESHYGDISKLLPFIEAQQPEDFERHIAAVERTNPGIMEGSIYPLPPLRAETPIRHGIKNAMTEADRIFYDLLPRAEIKRRSLESIVAQAKALVENSPEEAERIFEGVEDGSAPVTDINEMVVLQLLARTKTAMNRVQATINDGKGKADGLDALMKQRGELKDRMQRLVDTSAAAGREASSALNVRRAVVDEDYSYAGILATMQADNRGVPLTEAQEKIAEVMAPKLEAAAKERTAAQTEVDMQAVYDEVLADIEQRIKDAAEFEGTEKEMGERGKKAARAKKAGIDWFKPGAASFSLEGDASAAKSEKGDANAKAPPPIPKDAYKVVMEYAVSAIQSGSAAESAFNAEVEMEFGPKIKPYLADIFKTATKMKSLMAVKTKEGKTVRKPKVKETTADIAARIGKERDADPEASLDPTDIVGMVRANVEAGAGGGVTGEGKAVLAEAIRMTTEQLQEEGIELTEDEVRDAFTQYGQKTKLKKDSLSVKMREIRRIGQLVSAVRDAVQGKKEAEAALAAGEKPTSLTKPQLTGLEREKATQAVRDMDKARIAAIKELQEAASALGIDIGGAGSMASTLAAAKTRMTNAIEDVEREIRTKQRIQRSKKGVNYDAEATELKAKLDARRKERDEIFGPSELTDEQRLAAALAAAIRNEKEWNSKLVMAQLGIFEPTASTYRPVTSPELEEIKARTAAAREAVADLKAADSATQEAAKEKQLEARIAELEKQLASGIIAAPEKQQTAETQRVTELTARRDELKKAITARRKANQPVPDAEQKKLEALESQLARLIENKPKAEKAATVDTAEQAFARQQLEAARAELAEKRKNQPFDPDAWLAKTEKAIATRTAKLEERLASGDILPPVKAERPTSPALEAARHKYDKLIGELNRQRFKLELANRSRAGKFFGSIAEILQTSRAIITGGELSAVLRQGGFSTLGHPILGMQSAGEMLKSFVSERKAHTTQDEVNHWLQGSPMRGKLDITQHSGIRKHHMEEAYMSRWINENIPAWLRKIPVLGFGIETGRRFIAASARAYSTYLNVLRMKVAKNLLKTLPLNPAKPTQAEIQQIADFVNASTGRGKMPKRWQGGAVALNTLFFAPKNFISRVQLLIGQPLWHGTMRTRLIVAKEYARFLIGAATILALAKLGQDDDDPPIETDLRSSDFLKVRFGNTRLDIFSGLIQPLVFAGRTGTLETKTIAGKVKSLHGEAVKYGGDDWSDVAFRFGRTKFAPAPSATFDLLSGRNVVGQPASATDIGANMIIPMTFRDIAHAMEEQGATKGTILSMLAILGMGVNTFSDRKQTPPTGMNADAVVLKSRHELPVPSLSQKSKRPVFQGF